MADDRGRHRLVGILSDLVVGADFELCIGLPGFIGRERDCRYHIWHHYRPEAHDVKDYRTRLGKSVSKHQAGIAIEQNGNIKIVHYEGRTILLRAEERDEFPYPESKRVEDYYLFVINLLEFGKHPLSANDEIYLYKNDMIILGNGYAFEISRVFSGKSRAQEEEDSFRRGDTGRILLPAEILEQLKAKSQRD